MGGRKLVFVAVALCACRFDQDRLSAARDGSPAADGAPVPDGTVPAADAAVAFSRSWALPSGGGPWADSSPR